MASDSFPKSLLRCIQEAYITEEKQGKDWPIKGFIDIAQNIYTISNDTKVISKVIELMLLPVLQRFAEEAGYKFLLSREQNHYPDITFIKNGRDKIALDIKSTYKKNETSVSGFTLGSFTGYFRERNSTKNITLPYKEYDKHYILGVIYTRRDDINSDRKVYALNKLGEIKSVIKDLDFIVQEKYKIAKDRPGSGNTKNIGSCIKLSELKEGKGPFAKLGIKVFDDFWMHYMTSGMAKDAGISSPPYSNIDEYLKYRSVK